VSTGEIAYQQQSSARGDRRPAYGEALPPATAPARPEREAAGPLDRRSESILALAIITPVVAGYGALAYGVYLAADAIF
jgi:hypothetical protein